MREIKAYIRNDKIEDVISAVMAAGVAGFTVIDVCGLGGAAAEEKQWSIEYCKRYSRVTKLEIVCHNEEEARLIEVIRESAWSGHRGDGMIFTSPISEALRIRTGERGEAALKSTKKITKG
ncbi:MAG: P-II family nitrogen regulator [Thermodesulfobacteriota bacterium]